LKDADIVALSKADMVSEEAIGHAGETVHLINPKADIIRLSTRTGMGLSGLVRSVSEATVRV
jgi:G3E family GTPase